MVPPRGNQRSCATNVVSKSSRALQLGVMVGAAGWDRPLHASRTVWHAGRQATKKLAPSQFCMSIDLLAAGVCPDRFGGRGMRHILEVVDVVYLLVDALHMDVCPTSQGSYSSLVR